MGAAAAGQKNAFYMQSILQLWTRSWTRSGERSQEDGVPVNQEADLEGWALVTNGDRRGRGQQTVKAL